MSWLEAAVQMHVATLADRCGFEVRRGPSASSTKCPACGAERRHPSRRDRRGAVGIPHARPHTWRCFCCDAGGDALDFASYVIGGLRFRELDARRKREVRAWFERETGVGVPQVEYRRPPAPPPPQYPPQQEVRALWSAGSAVHADARCVGYLAYRGIDPRAVAEHDLAVALPLSGLPEWARIGERSWAHTAHRLLVPLHDHAGVLRSVLARSIDRQPHLKSAAPRGFGRGRLIMANSAALAMLRGRAQPDVVVIREGEIDFLAESVAQPSVAVLGIVSGSWCSAIAARIPDGARVIIATDADEAGDKYAAAIAGTLTGRARLERRRMAA